MGYGQPYALPHPGRPPERPELPKGASPYPRWPVWYAPVGFVTALAGTLMAVLVVGVIAALFGADIDSDSPALTIAGTFVQDAVFIGTAVFFASRTIRPRAWHFGLQRARFWPAVGWTALGFVGFVVFAATYAAIVQPEGEQTVAEDLGANDSVIALVIGALVVVVLAPIAEEFFFRGFFYRALRSRMGVMAAAVIDGLVFGVIHYENPDTLTLLPILAVLGFIFCLIYERTGTLYSVIALHAVNNSIAYAGATDDGWAASVPVGLATVIACMVLPRLGRARAPARR